MLCIIARNTLEGEYRQHVPIFRVAYVSGPNNVHFKFRDDIYIRCVDIDNW